MHTYLCHVVIYKIQGHSVEINDKHLGYKFSILHSCNIDVLCVYQAADTALGCQRHGIEDAQGTVLEVLSF